MDESAGKARVVNIDGASEEEIQEAMGHLPGLVHRLGLAMKTLNIIEAGDFQPQGHAQASGQRFGLHAAS